MADMQLTPKQITERYEKLKGERGNWETLYQEIGDLMYPRKNTAQTDRSPGEKRNIAVVNNVGMVSAEKLGGSLNGLLTNVNSDWFELTTGIQEIDDLDDVRKWLQKTSKEMLNVLNSSNFQTEIHEFYMDLVVFGTAVLRIEEDDKKLVRFKAEFIGDVVIKENNFGLVDEVYRKFKWDARNIVSEFGLDTLPRNIKKAFEEASDEKFEIIQAIYPVMPDPNDPASKAFISQYIAVDGHEQLMLHGFNEFPYIVARWAKGTGEMYGRSPAMNALPEVKTANIMEETQIKGAQKTVDPPLMLPDDGFMLPINTRPGSLNFFRPGSEKAEPMFPSTRVDFGEKVIERREARIREAFFVDQLQIPQKDRMTATETLQRVEEQSRLLGPLLGRQQFEFLRPLIDRVFAVMMRKNRIEEPPGVLEDRDIDVQYTSMIARSQRSVEARNMLQTIELLTPIFQLDPTVADNIDSDGYFKVATRIHNFPQLAIRDQDAIDALRENRAKAQQAQQEAEQAAQQADVVAKVGPTAVQAQAAG